LISAKGWIALGGLAAGIGSTVLIGLACSGPQPLSVAIDPRHERAYEQALREQAASPREAFYRAKARESGQSYEEVVLADEALSTTRNPFDAYHDPEAVSWGAVIYKQHCLECHGEKADGMGPSMPVELPKMDFHNFSHRFTSTLHRGAPRSWFRKIEEGYTSKVVNPDRSKNIMPPFKDVLAREQIWLAITYLQSLDVYSSQHQD
jgi:mono/diheme cytochrome c family protein